MKKLIVLLLLLQGCTTVSHHQREHECSENCNTFIKNMKNLEIDSRAFFLKLFDVQVRRTVPEIKNTVEGIIYDQEICDEPIGTFACSAAAATVNNP